MGKAITTTDPNLVTDYQYNDALDRLTRITYDLSGAVSSFTFPSGRVQSFNYDVGGQPLGVSGSYQGTNTTYASGLRNANASHAADFPPELYRKPAGPPVHS